MWPDTLTFGEAHGAKWDDETGLWVSGEYVIDRRAEKCDKLCTGAKSD